MIKQTRSLILASMFAVSCVHSTLAETKPAHQEVGVTDKSITVATCNALSGPSAFVGKEMNIGFDAYIRSVNAAGGINGRKIEVMPFDDRYEADVAESTVEKVRSANIFGVTGCFGSALLAKYLPKAEFYKIPFVGFYSGPKFVGTPVKHFVFGTRTDFESEENQVVQKLWEESGFRKFGVIYQNDSYGQQISEGVTQQLEKYKADVVAFGTYTRNSNNLKEAYDKVHAARPEVVILGAVYTPCAEVIRMANKDNWHPLFVMNSGSNVDAFLDTLGPDADGQLFTEVVPPFTRVDLNFIGKFTKLLKQYYPDEKPGFTNLRGYVNATVWVEALKRAGKNPTRESFVSALESIHDWDQGLGKGMELSYSPTNHTGRTAVFFCMTRKGTVAPASNLKRLKSS